MKKLLKARSNAPKSPKSGKPRFVLMIGDEGGILLLIEGTQVTKRLFAQSSNLEHSKVFSDVLMEYPAAPLYVLIDVIDQSYARHTLPPVSPLGINKIVERRLERDFAEDDIKGALSLGRSKEGRKDWNFLLISVGYSENIASWLDLILECPNPFEGIYLVPVESANTIKHLHEETFPKPKGVKKKKGKKKKGNEPDFSQEVGDDSPEDLSKPEWQILVSNHKIGGLRQVVLQEGNLVFTRVTQFGGHTTPEQIAGAVEQEIQNTIEYLKRMSLKDDSRLDIYVVAAQDILDSIAKDRIQCSHLMKFSPFKAAQLLHLGNAVLAEDRFGDIVTATSFGLEKKKRLRLTTVYTKKLQKLASLRKAVMVLGGLSLLVTFGFIGVQGFNIFSQYGENTDLEKKLKRKQTQLTEVQHRGDEFGVDPNMVSDLLAVYNGITLDHPSPDQAIEQLRGALSKGFLLKQLEWLEPEPELVVQSGIITQQPSGDETSDVPAPDTISLLMEVTYSGGEWETFIAQTDTRMNGVAELFPGYSMTRTKLPGQDDRDGPIEINFEERESSLQQFSAGESFLLKLDLSLPLSSELGGTQR